MALDGATLALIKREIESVALGARIDKIHKPSKDEVIIVLRHKTGSAKLLLSACAANARIQFTTVGVENPLTPPMFCVLLRKYIGNGKLIAVRQQGLDRILFLDFETTNELGDMVMLTLCIEIMGRHSNIILIGEGGRIVDAIKRVDIETSSVRQVLPGMVYTLPPAAARLSLAEHTPQEIITAIKAARVGELSKVLMSVLEGVSPILAREMAHFTTGGEEKQTTELTPEQFERLTFFIKSVGDILRGGKATPTVVLDESGKPRDFSFIDINQYRGALQTVQYESFSQLLDAFYSERGRIERMKQRSHDLLKLLNNTSERIARKLALQKEELLTCASREELRIKGELISANIYRLQKGDHKASLENYYDPSLPVLEIALDPSLAPQQNAQRYFQEYRKAANAEKKLTELIVSGEEELRYIDSVLDELSRTSGESELAEIREELAGQGYLRRQKGGKVQKQKATGPHRYRSSDGFLILVGRNNLSNDRLTLKDSKKTDIWFHTHNIHGSHTVLVTDGKAPSNQALEEAAILAAYHSKARESAQVPVDYTEIRNIKKPQGAKPGFVIYDPYKTAFVSPSAQKVAQLAEKAQK